MIGIGGPGLGRSQALIGHGEASRRDFRGTEKNRKP